MTRGAPVPAGMVRIAAGPHAAVVRTAYEQDARALLAMGALYDSAARTPGARTQSPRCAPR